MSVEFLQMEDVASEEEDIVKVISNGNGERKGGRLESREELNRDELEQEIGELERQLRQERDKSKQFRVDIQVGNSCITNKEKFKTPVACYHFQSKILKPFLY